MRHHPREPDGRWAEEGCFGVRHPLPFDPRTFSAEELAHEFGDGQPLEFSHSLEEQIGAQLDPGFRLTALYEDTQDCPLGRWMPTCMATRAIKP